MFVRPARSGAMSGTRSPKAPRPRISERSVAAVHDEEVDLVSRQIGQRIGHHARVLRFDVDHIGMALQEAEHPAHLLLALTRSQVVDDTDSQIACVLFVTEL